IHLGVSPGAIGCPRAATNVRRTGHHRSSAVTASRFDILGVGNAIVDVVAEATDAFLSKHDMRKGAMTLIDADAAEALYAAMPPGQESSGGSVANTCAVAAGL